MAESFKLQQQLDDEIPDTIEEQRQWLGEIIQRSEDANAALDAQKTAFDELRELERTAPEVLATIRAQTPVADADAKLAAADTAGAAVSVKAAQESLLQYKVLLEAIGKTEAAIKDAAASVAAQATGGTK